MKFEIGKYYKHTGGGFLHICGEVKTHIWGHCLIAENKDGRLVPVGRDESNAVNWVEISEEQYINPPKSKDIESPNSAKQRSPAGKPTDQSVPFCKICGSSNVTNSPIYWCYDCKEAA